MTETPDFDQLARAFMERANDQGSGSVFGHAVTLALAEQLRQVWNARGAADSHGETIDGVTNAVDDWVRSSAGTYDELQAVVEQALAAAIKRLDR
jgi:hypothetical protein